MSIRSLVRRVEKLESLSGQTRARTNEAFEHAMSSYKGCYGASQFESVISAFGAERTGRPLTEAEAAAKKEYLSEVKCRCQWAHVPMPATCPLEIVIPQALMTAWAFCGYWDLGSRGYQAVEAGREPSPDELDAMHWLEAANERVAHLAGFDSALELNDFVYQATAGGIK